MLSFVCNIFHNKKGEKLNCLIFLAFTYKTDTISALSHCIHSDFIEFPLCQFLLAGENTIYIKTITTIISQSTLDNCKFVPKNAPMAMESRLTLFFAVTS